MPSVSPVSWFASLLRSNGTVVKDASIIHMVNWLGTSFVTLIARFLGPTWGPSGADRTQVGPMLAPWTLLSVKTFANTGRRWPHYQSMNSFTKYTLSRKQRAKIKIWSKVYIIRNLTDLNWKRNLINIGNPYDGVGSLKELKINQFSDEEVYRSIIGISNIIQRYIMFIMYAYIVLLTGNVSSLVICIFLYHNILGPEWSDQHFTVDLF